MKRILYTAFSLLLLVSLLVLYLPDGCQLIQEGTPVSVKGGLNLYGTDPLTLDPAISGDMASHEYIVQIFSGLVGLDDNLEPAPDIARSWELSDDGRTYTFFLRDDVKFHDGRQVTAEDFKYSWERACTPGTGSLTAANYLGDIVGVKAVLAGESEEISEVRVVDDYTLEVTIDTPKSYFLSKMTYPTAFVVDRANVKSGKDWWRKPNGTGPFRLKQWEKENLLVLERNELHYGKMAEVESVVYQLWGGVPMNMYELGEIDITGAGIIYIDRVTDPAGPFYADLHVAPELSFSYIGFDTTSPPFDDADIRRAFSLAVDKDKLVSLVYRDMVKRADGILPPGMPGFNEELVGLPYNVAEARRLLADSSYGDVSRLPAITVTTSGEGGLISQGLEAIINEWRQNLGVEVTVRQLQQERFLYHLKEEKDEMFYIGWVADYPHPQDFLEVLFRSDFDNNYGGYSNPEVDALLERAGVEQDSDTSLALYQQAEQLLVDNAACIPLWFGENYILVKPYVRGYQPNPLGYSMLNSVSVEPH
ncbi:peptide ABC transporter substrate-binding protein [Chloroflexota bacterium]